MTGRPCRLLVVAVLTMSAMPVAAHAQTPSVSDPRAFRDALERVELAGVDAPAAAPARNGSRTRNTVLGAVIGAGAGLFIGEYWFGQGLDMPHGPDILLGAAVFGGAGALIGWALSGSQPAAPAPPKKTFAVAPVLSKSTKAVVVRLSFK